MKKRKLLFVLFTLVFIIATLLLVYYTYYREKNEVRYHYALDGDSLILFIDNKESEVRLLGIDCPEINDAFGKEARDFSDSLLKNAGSIRIEKDLASEEYDKYGRLLVWVFVDDELLQYKLVENGLAKARYIYGDYAYLEGIYDLQELAKKDKKGIWSIEE